MFVANWLTWVVEHQNWFLGAMGAALILYVGRGCISIISRQRIQSIGQIEDREKAGGHSASIGIPNWLAYTFLILSAGIPAVILIVVVIVHIVRAIAHDGVWNVLADTETIVSIIFAVTGFLLGLIVWGILRVIMWVSIRWFAKLFCGKKPRQDDLQREVKRLEFIQDLLIDMLKKRLFPDRRTEVAIREAIGKPKGRISESDVEGLTKLDANKKKIINLSGIEHCTNLQKLNLYDNHLRDISPLSSLTNLQELVLTDGGIRNIRPLSNLTTLQTLRLGSNFVSDISPLGRLINLQELYLRGNQINNISPLSSLTNMQRLDLGGNQIRSINPLKSLANLQELVLTDNWISDISPLVNNSGIGKGTVVDLMDNPLNGEAYDIHIPALQERGVIVRSSPKS